MATRGRIEVTPDPVGGRDLARRMGGGGAPGASGAVTEIELDSEALLDQAAQWQARADTLREMASKAKEITEKADSESGGFKSEYETPGVYDNTYGTCKTGSGIIETQVLKAADAIERAAQSMQWVAENNDEAQRIAAQRTSDIDAELSAGEGSGTAQPKTGTGGTADVLGDTPAAAQPDAPDTEPPAPSGGTTYSI